MILSARNRAGGKTLSADPIIAEIFDKLYQAFGPQHWWPGDSAFEVIVGAILTQNTNWKNVKRAIDNLKAARVLSPGALKNLSTLRLATLIKPAGYFNVKARRIKNFVQFLFRGYAGSLDKLGQEKTPRLREKLLEVNGIGPETADSILLYAFNRPAFVIDAYTKRFLYRHNLIEEGTDYHGVQKIFLEGLRPWPQVFNEYHALIVKLGKDFCSTRPRCEACPLRQLYYSLEKRCARCFRAFRSGEKSKPSLCLSCFRQAVYSAKLCEAKPRLLFDGKSKRSQAVGAKENKSIKYPRRFSR